jgi:aspartate/methionine/tyrosine aminotransferase
MAGGVTKFVPLRLDEQNLVWKFDVEELEKAITPSTKILLINSPHNPTGKVFNHEEILQIVDIVNRNPQLTVVMDEVRDNSPYLSFIDSLSSPLPPTSLSGL